MFTPASAIWNQRFEIASSRNRLMDLRAAVGRDSDLGAHQVAQLFAAAMEYRPDLILELGRGAGNSTCVFTEAANRICLSNQRSGKSRVVSLCRSPSWEHEPPRKIAAAVPPEWFESVTTLCGNILDFDYSELLGDAKRVLVFWDAHGYDIAECVLAGILPRLAGRDHLVIMHDLTDSRFREAEYRDYAGKRLWRGNNQNGQRVCLGHIASKVEQVVAIVDFMSRNRLELHSAEESVHDELVCDEQKMSELRETIGDEFFSTRAQWFYFTLNGQPGPFTFPRFPTPEERGNASPP